MPFLLIKKENQLEKVESWDYSKDNREDYLHRIIESNSNFIFEEEEKRPIAIGSKMYLGEGQLDLLFIDNEGKLTLVELKRGRPARQVIGQIFDYASSLRNMTLDELENHLNLKFKEIKDIFHEFESQGILPNPEFTLSLFEENVKNSLKDPKIVLISYKIGEDVERIIDYLIEHDFPIEFIEFEYYKRGEYEIFVPKSKKIVSFKTKKAEPKELSEIKKKYLSLFDSIIEEFKRKKPNVTQRGPTADSWMSLPCGYGSDIHFEWWIRGREPNKDILIALHLEGEKDFNFRLFDILKKNRELYEKKIGEKLNFEKPWGKEWAQIYSKKFIGNLDKGVKDEEVKQWAVDTMIKFYDTFKPELDKIVPTIS